MTEVGVKWACDYCTYENWPSAVKCTMCRAQCPSSPIITKETYNSSSPSSVTMEPGCDWQDPPSPEGSCGSLLIYPDSSARPRVKPPSVTENSSKWSCHMCTYLNWPRAIRCTQCLCQRHQRTPCSPTEAPQTSGTNVGYRPAPPPMDPCTEEYNDRNRLNRLNTRGGGGGSSSSQHWTCTACTYQNYPKTRKCIVCDHPQPQPNNREAIPIELAGQSEDAPSSTSSNINEQDRDRARWRGSGGSCSRGLSGGQRQRQGLRMTSPPTSKREAEVKMDFQRIELAAGAMGSGEEQHHHPENIDFKKTKQIKNRMRKTDWLFLNACAGG